MNKTRRNKARKRRLGPMVERRIGRPDGSVLVLSYRGEVGEDPRPRPICFCVHALLQSCSICDPEGRAFAVIRPELAVRIWGC